MSVQEVLPQEGFDGIAIAPLLGLSDPIGIFFAAFLIAYMKLGGQAIQNLRIFNRVNHNDYRNDSLYLCTIGPLPTFTR